VSEEELLDLLALQYRAELAKKGGDKNFSVRLCVPESLIGRHSVGDWHSLILQKVSLIFFFF
jgi:hypothetical protein